jgi:large subunit ribosomal protein L13
MKTYMMKTAEADKKWVVLDAEDVVLGRLASTIATLLRGKHKPTFTPSVDCGDYVVVVNAEKVRLTGNKLRDKIFYYHTGHPGGIKERSMSYILNSRFPERVIEKAVQRMLDRGPMGRKQMGNLRVYKGPEHPHTAQSPTAIDFAARNPKNKRSA